MRVHTQLNYKRKLQVDQAVVKTGSTEVYAQLAWLSVS